jgi:hypothetical protein
MLVAVDVGGGCWWCSTFVVVHAGAVDAEGVLRHSKGAA